MNIGHYGVSLALKKADNNISLGLLFIAAQFIDILWAVLVLLGIERAEIVPGITAANPIDYVYYPFSHSLVASLVWAESCTSYSGYSQQSQAHRKIRSRS